MSKTRGFTLIELMVTLAIVGLLAAIALPSYRDSVRKSQRADAQISLSSLATQQEKFYFRTNNYTDDFSDLVTGVAAGTVTIESDEGHYDITLAAGANLRSWTMTANPKGAQVDDAECAAIVLTNTGVKTSLKADLVTPGTGCW